MGPKRSLIFLIVFFGLGPISNANTLECSSLFSDKPQVIQLPKAPLAAIIKTVESAPKREQAKIFARLVESNVLQLEVNDLDWLSILADAVLRNSQPPSNAIVPLYWDGIMKAERASEIIRFLQENPETAMPLTGRSSTPRVQHLVQLLAEKSDEAKLEVLGKFVNVEGAGLSAQEISNLRILALVVPVHKATDFLSGPFNLQRKLLIKKINQLRPQ